MVAARAWASVFQLLGLLLVLHCVGRGPQISQGHLRTTVAVSRRSCSLQHHQKRPAAALPLPHQGRARLRLRRRCPAAGLFGRPRAGRFRHCLQEGLASLAPGCLHLSPRPWPRHRPPCRRHHLNGCHRHHWLQMWPTHMRCCNGIIRFMATLAGPCVRARRRRDLGSFRSSTTSPRSCHYRHVRHHHRLLQESNCRGSHHVKRCGIART